MSAAPGPGRLDNASDPQQARRPQVRLDKPHDLLWPEATQWLAIGALTLSIALVVWQVYPLLSEVSSAGLRAKASNSRELEAAARLNKLEFENETQAARIRQIEQQLARLNGRPAAMPAPVSFGTRPRIRFQIRQGETVNLAPGAALAIERVDAEAQRVSGSIRLTEKGGAKSIRRLGVLEGLHLSEGGQGYDLIVTAVSAETVVGYLVLPPPEAK